MVKTLYADCVCLGDFKHFAAIAARVSEELGAFLDRVGVQNMKQWQKKKLVLLDKPDEDFSVWNER